MALAWEPSGGSGDLGAGCTLAAASCGPSTAKYLQCVASSWLDAKTLAMA
ncbi:MAG: hypothetical protein ACOH2F_09445 [Cellulomonas sp.]